MELALTGLGVSEEMMLNIVDDNNDDDNNGAWIHYKFTM